jgi:hypothetical protein
MGSDNETECQFILKKVVLIILYREIFRLQGLWINQAGFAANRSRANQTVSHTTFRDLVLSLRSLFLNYNAAA